MRRHKKSSNSSLFKSLFKKKNAQSQPQPQPNSDTVFYEPKPVKLSKLINLMKRVNLDEVEMTDAARRHWDQLIEVEERVADRIIKVFVPISVDNSSTSSDSPPPNDALTTTIGPLGSIETDGATVINFSVIQAIIRSPSVIGQYDTVLHNINSIEGRTDWFSFKDAGIGEQHHIRI